MDEQILRDEELEPYHHGPKFRIITWVTDRTDRRGQTIIGYRFTEIQPYGRPEVIFCGEDFAGSPLHADDSDETLKALLGFITLRPGDTDREFFEKYTARQLRFANEHAEILSAIVEGMFA
jgi:hypothetical protein